jgi:hypothetical protein
VPLLVLDPLLENQDCRSIAREHLRRVGQIPQIEVGRMSTPQEIDQIGGRQQKTPGEKFALLTIQPNRTTLDAD